MTTLATMRYEAREGTYGWEVVRIVRGRSERVGGHFAISQEKAEGIADQLNAEYGDEAK